MTVLIRKPPACRGPLPPWPVQLVGSDTSPSDTTPHDVGLEFPTNLESRLSDCLGLKF